MNTEKTVKSSEDYNNTTRFSTGLKLNAHLFFRLLGIFLTLNVFLGFGTVVTMVIIAEQKVSSAVYLLSEMDMPDKNTQAWLETSGLNITPLKEQPLGFKPPSMLSIIIPENTVRGSRRFILTDPVYNTEIDKDFFLNRLSGLTYIIELMIDNEPYAISVALGPVATILKVIFFLLLIIQATMLIGNIIFGARVIRRTLSPISELVATAETLNMRKGAFTPEEMEELAGKLDGINAAKLDTRIPIDGAQDELNSLSVAINGMLDRINESYRQQVRFVSDASHELRTPISVIQGYANLLDRWGKNDPKALQESIDAIKDETTNMKMMVEQLLFLARGDNNTMSLQLESFELSALADEVLRETQMLDKGHEYQSSFSDVYIFADQALVKQSLRILVDNAIKYTPVGGNIAISVNQEDELARLTVQDDGIGIPPEAVGQIFDRFYRADESRARATGGTGLGLSIAKWITERHGGHMEVLSRQDIGTRISIALPIAK